MSTSLHAEFSALFSEHGRAPSLFSNSFIKRAGSLKNILCIDSRIRAGMRRKRRPFACGVDLRLRKYRSQAFSGARPCCAPTETYIGGIA